MVHQSEASSRKSDTVTKAFAIEFGGMAEDVLMDNRRPEFYENVSIDESEKRADEIVERNSEMLHELRTMTP